MGESERITWENCPLCGQQAAVGWSSDAPIEFDCPDGCSPEPEQVRAFPSAPGGGAPPA